MSYLLDRLEAERRTIRAQRTADHAALVAHAEEQRRHLQLRTAARAYSELLDQQDRRTRQAAAAHDERLTAYDQLVTRCAACDGLILAGTDRRTTSPYLNGQRALIHACPARRQTRKAAS